MAKDKMIVGEKPSADYWTEDEEEWLNELERELKRLERERQNEANDAKYGFKAGEIKKRRGYDFTGNAIRAKEFHKKRDLPPLPKVYLPSDCDCGFKTKQVPLRSHSGWCTYATFRRSLKEV